jgi:quinol-cytochrome oxidoreductase complex cytochrome b subunit
VNEARYVRFFPHFVYRDLMSWIVGLFVLIALSSILPKGLDEKANPFASAPAGIKPEWYFLPLFQTLRMVPGTVVGISGELLVNLAVVIGIGIWLLIPFLDRRAAGGLHSPTFTMVGVVGALYMLLTIVLAYLTT